MKAVDDAFQNARKNSATLRAALKEKPVTNLPDLSDKMVRVAMETYLTWRHIPGLRAMHAALTAALAEAEKGGVVLVKVPGRRSTGAMHANGAPMQHGNTTAAGWNACYNAVIQGKVTL